MSAKKPAATDRRMLSTTTNGGGRAASSLATRNNSGALSSSTTSMATTMDAFKTLQQAGQSLESFGSFVDANVTDENQRTCLYIQAVDLCEDFAKQFRLLSTTTTTDGTTDGSGTNEPYSPVARKMPAKEAAVPTSTKRHCNQPTPAGKKELVAPSSSISNRPRSQGGMTIMNQAVSATQTTNGIGARPSTLVEPPTSEQQAVASPSAVVAVPVLPVPAPPAPAKSACTLKCPICGFQPSGTTANVRKKGLGAHLVRLGFRGLEEGELCVTRKLKFLTLAVEDENGEFKATLDGQEIKVSAETMKLLQAGVEKGLANMVPKERGQKLRDLAKKFPEIKFIIGKSSVVLGTLKEKGIPLNGLVNASVVD